MARKKKGREKKDNPSTYPDAKLALDFADAFRRASRPFLEKVIGKSKAEVEQEAKGDFPGLVVSATTLALSIELYLKALWVLHGKRAPDTHHLWTIYRALPRDLQKSVEESYERNPNRLGMGIRVQMAPDHARPDLVKPPPTDNSFRGVLERNSDAFIRWRYLYEGGRAPVADEGYEYHSLGVIADVLRDHVLVGLKRLEELREEARARETRGQG